VVGKIVGSESREQGMRRLLFAGVLGVWVVMVGLLVQRTLPSAPAPAVSLEPRAPALGDEWMGVYMQAQKIGYTHHGFTAEADGFAFSEESLLHLTVMGAPQVVRTRVVGHAGRDYALRDVEFALSSGVGSLQAAGVVRDGSLRLTLRSGKEVSEQVLPLAEPLYLPSTLRASLSGDALRAGRRLDALVFDPTSLKNDRLHVTIEGEEPVPASPDGTRGWKVREEFRGLQTTAWVDPAGTVLREEGPMGFVLVHESADRAVTAGWGAPETALDLVAKAAVPVAVPIAEPRTRRMLRLRVSGIALENVPSDDEQQRTGAVVTIRRPLPAHVASYELPYRGPLVDELRPTPFLQSDHPKVQALARDIVGGERDAKRVAMLLNDWVYAHLRKVPTISIPNALQVLDMGEGDCNEHAVLLAALGRAAGVPTRVVAGAVYLDGAFFYHAWCEVWLERWVSIDPALHQFPADATHIKFVAGDPEDQVAMMGIIGRLGLEVLGDSVTAAE